MSLFLVCLIETVFWIVVFLAMLQQWNQKFVEEEFVLQIYT